MLGTKERIMQLRSYRSLTTGSTARFSLYACMKILEKRNEVQKIVRKVMDENRKTVREMLPKAGLKFTTPDRSSFIYVHTDGESSQMAEDMLSKEGIFVSPGKYFGIPTGYRLCITSSPDQFRKDLEKLCEYHEGREKS